MKKHVEINHERINEFAERLVNKPLRINEWDAECFMNSNNIELVTQYFFVGNSINFCFFYDNFSEKYRYQSYWGSAAMWKFLDNSRLLDAKYLADIQMQNWPDIERMPMPEARIKALQEVGAGLTERYAGEAINICEEGGWDAQKILDIIVDNFPLWKDEYNGVKFNKRARLFLLMLYGKFQRKRLIRNIEEFPCLPDYQVPKTLHAFGILEYSDELKWMVQNQIEIPYKSDMEFDIRVKTMEAACEIVKIMRKKGKKIQCFQLDYYLWDISHELDTPHHLTRTMAY